MTVKIDSRQIKKIQALPVLGAIAGENLSTILDKVNAELDSPLRLAASSTPDAKLNFSSSLISSADGANKINTPVTNLVFPNLSSPFINFQTQALSSASHFTITWPGSNTVGNFRHVGFVLISTGKIEVTFSAAAASEGALVDPGSLFTSDGVPLGYITLECTSASGYFKTAGSASNVIENAKVFRFSAGGGGGGSSSTSESASAGGDIFDLRFLARIEDSFTSIPSTATPVNVSAGFTDLALHDATNSLFRLNYDASKTVTGTGTAMTLSSAPSFTIKAGDVLVVGNEVRRISSITSQTVVTIELAFTVDPSAAACNVSQAVHTRDLNAFDAGGTGLSVSSQITSNVEEVLVSYEDSTTLDDIIPDWGTSPVVGYSVSSDNSSWSTLKLRETLLSSINNTVLCPTANTQFLIRLFANKTSGSGAVNLLSFKAAWHKQEAEASSPVFGIAVNGTIADKTANYTTVDGDAGKVILFDLTSSALTATLHTPSTSPFFLTFKDSTGNAATNNLSIVSAGSIIDGSLSTETIVENYGSATFMFNGTNWYRIASYIKTGSGTGDSASAGGDIFDLRFLARIEDSLSVAPSAETPVDNGAGKTDSSLFSATNSYFRLNYDASKTVTGTGTAMTLSSAPSFTIKAGDLIVINSSSEVRRISSITSQTVVTIESAFTSNPSAAACNVSQAVHTRDLNAFDAGGTGLAVSSQITTNVQEVLVSYEDSTTLADIIPDWGVSPVIAYSVSADDSNWSIAKIRETLLSSINNTVMCPTSSTKFLIRLFANKTSGSGAVNLLSFKAAWHKQAAEVPSSTGIAVNGAYTDKTANYTTTDADDGKVIPFDVSGSAKTLTLHTPSYFPFFVSAKDIKGNSATNNISITHPSVAIDDTVGTVFLNTNYGIKHLMYDGVRWIRIS